MEYVRFGQRPDRIAMEDYLLLHKWFLGDVTSLFYTDNYKRTFQRALSPLPVQLLEVRLLKANGPHMNGQIIKALKKLEEGY